jgi:hypothetical protein
MGISILGTPVYRLTGQSAYFPRLAAFGEGGTTFLRNMSCWSYWATASDWFKKMTPRIKPALIDLNFFINLVITVFGIVARSFSVFKKSIPL